MTKEGKKKYSKRYSSYSLRTTAIESFYENVSSPPSHFQEFAGHTSPITTMTYLMKKDTSIMENTQKYTDSILVKTRRPKKIKTT